MTHPSSASWSFIALAIDRIPSAVSRLEQSWPAVVWMLLILLCGTTASAATVLDDFSYSPDNTTLSGKTGGSGWSGAWGASTGTLTARVKIDVDGNLTYSGGDYAVSQTGTGLVYGDFGPDFRGINRYIDTNLTGTVWFSILARNLAGTDHGGIQFNNHADTGFSGLDYVVGPNHVELSGTDLVVRYGGANSTVASNLTLGNTHLLLGRITFQANGSNDRLEVWADPVDLFNLGSPLFSNDTTNMGTNLYLAGVFGYGSSSTVGTRQGLTDALRISDGGGDALLAFTDVTGVPEPSTFALLALGVIGFIGRSRRR